MSKRYIDANLLLAQCRRNPLFEKTEKDKGMVYIERSIIDNTPTADVVEVRHGEWRDRHENKYANHYYECSVCENPALDRTVNIGVGTPQQAQVLSPFCPNCGAKMDGEKQSG